MCLIVEIGADGLTLSEAKRIAAGSPLVKASDHPPRLTLDACDLLADSADWDAATWDITAHGRAVIRDLLRLVYADVPGPISLTALWWEGMHAPRVPMEDITRAELLARVEANRVSTRSGYRVAPGDVTAPTSSRARTAHRLTQ